VRSTKAQVNPAAVFRLLVLVLLYYIISHVLCLLRTRQRSTEYAAEYAVALIPRTRTRTQSSSATSKVERGFQRLYTCGALCPSSGALCTPVAPFVLSRGASGRPSIECVLDDVCLVSSDVPPYSDPDSDSVLVPHYTYYRALVRLVSTESLTLCSPPKH
jgi:hypothetical protein